MTQQFLAVILLVLSVYPMWRYLKRKEKTIPFVPFFSLAYGIYYGVFPILPFEEFIRLRELPIEIKTKAQFLATIGFLIFLLVFYRFPIVIWKRFLPQISIEWSENKAKHTAVLLGIIGLGVNFFFRKVIEAPMEFWGILTFINDLSLISFVMLFLLYLRGNLSFPYKIFLWGLLFPFLLLVNLTGGTIFPIIKLFLIILMLVLLVKRSLFKRKLIWVLISIIIPILMLFLVTKHEFRALSWEEGGASGNPFERISLYFDVINDYFLNFNTEQSYLALETVFQRFDLSNMFAYVVNYTPDVIPYWHGESYSALLTKMIPRVFYPDKPLENMGQVFGRRYEWLDPEDLSTSVNFPQLIEMYANFGVLGVFVGMFLIGLLYQCLYYSLNHLRLGSWGIISSVIVFSSLMNIESNFSMVYGGIVFTIMLLYFIGRFIGKGSQTMCIDQLSVKLLNPK